MDPLHLQRRVVSAVVTAVEVGWMAACLPLPACVCLGLDVIAWVPLVVPAGVMGVQPLVSDM